MSLLETEREGFLTSVGSVKTIDCENKNGGKGGDRTHDTRIFSPLLYQLSYLATRNTANAANMMLRIIQHFPKRSTDILCVG